MPLNFNTNVVVPALPDNDVWWANSAAWSNYWANINIQGSFDAYGTVAYAEVPFDNTTQGINFLYGNVNYALTTQQQFNSLLAAYQALNADYKTLKANLVAIGLITTA